MINAKHPLQSKEWGEFRKLTGVKVVRDGDIQVTIHKIPYAPWSVGYCPKGPMPDIHQVEILRKIARDNNCIFIKCEPMVEVGTKYEVQSTMLKKMGFVEGRALFTKYNFVLDVTPPEQELLASFKQKTRYNIKVAEKNGVSVEIDDSEAAFERYLELTEETTKRQGFYAHSTNYHRKMWKIIGNNQSLNSNNQLTAHLLVAKYNGEIITTWVLFKYGDTLYYPYGASTREHREVMANNLVMWSAIKLAKEWGLRYLDMWGALGPEADPKDPWYGFHTFKSGYSPRQVEYIGTWDYVTYPLLYRLYRVGENLRWWWLRSKKGRD
ncbi:MAG: peptidoglycan bridge formation glycyltransferase FemA/FemB family protein [Microgenomates group bacterium]